MTFISDVPQQVQIVFAHFHPLSDYYPTISILMRLGSYVVLCNLACPIEKSRTLPNPGPLINRTLEFSRSLESLYSSKTDAFLLRLGKRITKEGNKEERG